MTSNVRLSPGSMVRRTSRADAMAAFDELPRPLREALAYSIDQFSTQQVLLAYLQCRSLERVLERIARNNAIELARRAEQSRLAIGPYAGNNPRQLDLEDLGL